MTQIQIKPALVKEQKYGGMTWTTLTQYNPNMLSVVTILTFCHGGEHAEMTLPLSVSLISYTFVFSMLPIRSPQKLHVNVLFRINCAFVALLSLTVSMWRQWPNVPGNTCFLNVRNDLLD